MKKYISRYWFFAALVSLAASCSKDMGNYSYHDINEFSIQGIEAAYSVTTAIDTLKITPEIGETLPEGKENSLTYYWIIKGTNNFQDTIGTEASLSYPVDLVPGKFDLQFRIIDNATNVAWWKNSTLTVGTPYSRGILLIGENEQSVAEAAMISMAADTTVIGGILSGSGLPELHDPKSFVFTSGMDMYKKLWIFTGSGSYHLDRFTMKGDVNNQFGKQIFTNDPIDVNALQPVALAPQIRTAAGATGTDYIRVMLCGNGALFASYLLITGGDFYTNQLNRTPDKMDKLLKAAPYLMYSIGNMNSITWYDTENKRFLNLSNLGLSTSSNVLTDSDGDPFPWDQKGVNRDLVYAENTRNSDGGSTNGNTFTILKDPAGQYFVYKFYGYGALPAKRAAYKILPIARDFGQADHYAFSSNRTVIFYSVGNQLYAYDYNPGHEKFYTFPEFSGDEITMLKFDTQIDYLDNSLYLATYNSKTKGSLRRLQVGSNPNVVQLQPVENAAWEGFFKIRDMNWRSSN